MAQQTSGSNQSLDRALELLTTMATTGVAMNIADISKYLSVTRATAQATANSLTAQNFLEKDPDTGRYGIGYRLYALGNMYRYQFPILNTAEKYVNSYNQKYGEKVNFSVLKPYFACVLLLSKSASLISAHIHGHVIPAYASASGKVLLAELPEARLDDWLQRCPLKPLTSKTIVDPVQLKEQLAQIRADGYAASVDELSCQESCLAVPIRDISGQVRAAISFSVSTNAFNERFNELHSELTLLGGLISSELGYSSIDI